ncbi:glycosyltransferase [Brevundimonas sp. DC300-4]|uniref:glycosyltransferase n=1 Tax=Brevundimonas sp. DC300-4 TaxID=2804594 RepID=UPI003CEDBF80
MLKGIVQARHSAQAAFQELVSFDAAAFAAHPANQEYCRPQGGLDFNAPIERRSPAPVMLPLFSEGLSGVRRPSRLTIGEWLDETQNAALAGALTHWLWDEGTYRRNRAVTDSDLDAGPPDGLAFLDFLTVGDEAGVSPHPLFCHHAYRTLNRDSVSQALGFRHFVAQPDACDLRTSALFDPEFYLSRQPQVRTDIAAGLFGSPLEHFVRQGLAAGYDFSPDFDRHFYLSSNPDVGDALGEGRIPSPEWHYVFDGAREGRAPNPFFNAWYYASRYPFVAEEMARLGISSTLEHFILIGQSRGWVANPPLAERAVTPDDGRALFEKRGRRAYGEILDGGIVVPAAGSPRLSVIVPVSNQADFTAGFLKSAAFAMEVLRARRNIETEILIIDSGSRDHTESLLAAVPNVIVEKLTTPFSFPAAVNAGAAKARGDILLVANNDIEFQPDAFDRVFAILDDDPSVGLVGAKVILPNETLQEVGASLDRLGNTHGMGRGVDAFRVTNNRRLAVDYASGCFIGFRRADFDALSGFEEAFSPGYYEDVDFALRMRRDLNKTTVVDTGLTVIHYENASFAKGRPATVNMSGAIRNRLLLKTRHAALFREMTGRAGAGRASASRQAVFGGNRVLVVQDLIPAAGLGARFARLETILDAFTRIGIAFDIMALSADEEVDCHKDPRATVFRGWLPGQSLQDILQRHGADYSHVWVCRAGNIARHSGVLAQARADFNLKLICDLETLSGPETAERTRPDAGDAAALSDLAGELILSIDVDQWVAVDDRDRALVESLGLGPVLEVGDGLKPPGTAGSARPARSRAVSVSKVGPDAVVRQVKAVFDSLSHRS